MESAASLPRDTRRESSVSRPRSSFLKRLIERLACGAVPVDGVQCADPNDAPHGLQTPAAGPERAQPTQAEVDYETYPRNGSNYR
jgi:hypothetical protein